MSKVSFERQQEVLHSPFDIETHKETFVNYLEVCIDSIGVVHYAVPSHAEWLIQRYMDIYQCTREQAMEDAPPASYGDISVWFTRMIHCIAVWNDHYIGKANAQQIVALKRLKEAGLYTGEICDFLLEDVCRTG